MPPRTRRPRREIPLEAAKPGVTVTARPPGEKARGYTWPPFEPGNAANATHGAGDLSKGHIGRIDPDDRGRGLSLRAQERAALVLQQVLEDPAFPEYLKAPMFRIEVESWTRVQTQADMVYEWFLDLPEDEKYVPPKAGAQKTPLELWLGVDAQAAKYRNRLGLNPVSYAKLRVALGLHRKQQDDAIAGLGRKGAKIRKAREAKVIQMRAEDGDERGA